MIDLAKSLTAIRNNRKMTIDQVVALSGVTKSTASKVFSGIETNPKLNTVVALLSAMGASLDDIDPIVQKTEVPTPQIAEWEPTDEELLAEFERQPRTVKLAMIMFARTAAEQYLLFDPAALGQALAQDDIVAATSRKAYEEQVLAHEDDDKKASQIS